MKQLLFILTFIFFCFLCTLAQVTSSKPYSTGFEWEIVYPTAISYSHVRVVGTEEKKENFSGEYHWNEDHNILSVPSPYYHYPNGYGSDILTYYFDEKKRLVRSTQSAYNIDNSYIYDEDGNMIELSMGDTSKRLFSYENGLLVSSVYYQLDKYLNEWVYTDKIEYAYDNFENSITEIHSSYNYESKTFLYRYSAKSYFDDKDRIIQYKELDRSYAHTHDYEYTDNGYKLKLDQGGAAPTFYIEQRYNSHGDLIFSEWLTKDDTYGRYHLDHRETWSYIYPDSGIDDVELSGISFHIEGNSIFIDNPTPIKAYLYSVNGFLISVSSDNKIDVLNNGIYLLRCGGTTYKVRI